MSGFVTSVLDQAFTHLCSCFGVEVNYVWNLEKNLAALEGTMKVLEDRRADVQRKVHRKESEGLQRLNEVQGWLSSVENIQNQVDELLLPRRDELERLCLCGLCSKNLSSSHSYGKRVFEMLKNVENVLSRGVFEVVAERLTIAETVERPLPNTIVGQEKMLKRAWEHLMDGGTGMMGLYGMGGVGKTTLLEQMNNKFPVDGAEIVIFVVVSSQLRVEMIQDAIAEKLGYGGEEWSRKTKSQKVIALYTRMKTKKFVLLLDDIWEEVDLEEIGVPFPTRENECKVVFTTRSRKVCGQMGVHDPIEVKCLGSNKAWDLFCAKVGKITLESQSDILELACQVAGECRGLPLALNIIGKNMASKRTVEEWKLAIDTLASSAAEFPGMEDNILPILKYSYDSLKGEHVKSCFEYCALFPEDFEIPKEKLVDYWICEGFIDEKQGRKKARNQAYGIIGTLVEACLLTEGQDESEVKMHDVVREMALWIASDVGKDKERCIVKAGVRLREVPTVDNWRSVRRMSLMDNEIENISESPNCPELTTLLLQKNVMVNISGEFFKYMPRLVVLDLSGNRLLDSFPDEVSKLVSLRYFDLSGNIGIQQRLFACLLELKNLIYLNLERSGLESIFGISSLSSLRTLRLRYNKLSRDSNVIEELQLLKHLEVVTIEIESILVADQLVNAYSTANAIHEIFIGLLEEESILTLPNMAVLSNLEMFGSRMVEINVKRSTSSLNKSPTAPSLPNLSHVSLRYCDGLKDLTWLLFAPNLKDLIVWNLAQVENIISKEKAATILIEEEASTNIPFQKLEFFRVGDLPKLKSIYWSTLPFPRLRKFYIGKCPNLKKLPLDSKSGGEDKLVIHNSEQYWIDEVEWEDEATKEPFLRSISPLLMSHKNQSQLSYWPAAPFASSFKKVVSSNQIICRMIFISILCLVFVWFEFHYYSQETLHKRYPVRFVIEITEQSNSYTDTITE